MDALNVINVGTDRINSLFNIVLQYGTAVVLKLVIAALLWIVGRWLIGVLVRMAQRSLTRQRFDPTVLRYVGSFITVTLNIILVIAILSYCGIETTSFAALLAAVALAIGMAWSGLLANLAAGGFIIVLRPFKVGDVITAAEVTGTVVEIGLFVTSINTPDNVLNLVGNNKIFSDTIVNYSSNDFRGVELTATLPATVDEQAVISRLKEQVGSLANVLSSPPVDVHLSGATADSITLAVRPFCHHDNYETVHCQTLGVIRTLMQDMPATKA
ncbi:mechanosensitive ion channel family protein [Pseudomonas syringae]|uniref:Small-conductance mechanosensitive channel n=3 Tax=Pseudomonas syringae TaxID=317 RepID=A0A656JP86_PSESF|nr:mechanosensitive ion channel family protein [Pseudomonas syringae]EPN41894.1 mechanosensitive ion channel protein MscS [Pseudomonas syringae pv. actinidiae ICMP 19096]EPM50596.1 mechanosensitive ion channel protein MscS [Pseudomonas syringae pv. actinidiae ICMP 19098]EPN14831.1 mechanosensitive ion channel protein MscS [Pseudomonas syringae pv. actinidiae ICMP 18804]EPN20719.1 mechanosensitive ion channel protein MscS [Pseudomonas syringae pv. actinidiae ICMP 19100]EPN28420.1 mechanosensiti